MENLNDTPAAPETPLPADAGMADPAAPAPDPAISDSSVPGMTAGTGGDGLGIGGQGGVVPLEEFNRLRDVTEQLKGALAASLRNEAVLRHEAQQRGQPQGPAQDGEDSKGFDPAVFESAESAAQHKRVVMATLSKLSRAELAGLLRRGGLDPDEFNEVRDVARGVRQRDVYSTQRNEAVRDFGAEFVDRYDDNIVAYCNERAQAGNPIKYVEGAAMVYARAQRRAAQAANSAATAKKLQLQQQVASGNPAGAAGAAPAAVLPRIETMDKRGQPRTPAEILRDIEARFGTP